MEGLVAPNSANPNINDANANQNNENNDNNTPAGPPNAPPQQPPSQPPQTDLFHSSPLLNNLPHLIPLVSSSLPQTGHNLFHINLPLR